MAKIIPVKNETIKEIISSKASRLFKEKGFNATSMREIADVIGVEAPSLYNHITSKKEILKEICFRVANLFNKNINAVEASGQSSSKKLESVIRFHIHMMLDEYQSVYISEHEWKHLPEPYLSNFKAQRKIYRSRLANIIEEGIANKELNTVDPAVAVLSILSAVGGIEYWHRSKKNIDAKSLEENIIKLLLHGIKR
jgi:AcrR family transcriptional regulator